MPVSNFNKYLKDSSIIVDMRQWHMGHKAKVTFQGALEKFEKDEKLPTAENLNGKSMK